jgi:hypothetical protein
MVRAGHCKTGGGGDRLDTRRGDGEFEGNNQGGGGPPVYSRGAKWVDWGIERIGRQLQNGGVTRSLALGALTGVVRHGANAKRGAFSARGRWGCEGDCRIWERSVRTVGVFLSLSVVVNVASV